MDAQNERGRQMLLPISHPMIAINCQRQRALTSALLLNQEPIPIRGLSLLVVLLDTDSGFSALLDIVAPVLNYYGVSKSLVERAYYMSTHIPGTLPTSEEVDPDLLAWHS